MTVSTTQRFTKKNPCPICQGYAGLPHGVGRRCFGFLSDDGLWAHCTREEYAGGIAQKPGSNTYAHTLQGRCRCGTQHGADSPAFVTIDLGNTGYKSNNGNDKVVSFHSKSDKLEDSWITDHYDYVDLDGVIRLRVVRYRLPDGSKTFRQWQPDNKGGWIRNLEGVKRIPYMLPDLLAADKDDYVFVVEGEKDVNTLTACGLVATCNPMGAKKWLPEFSEYLKDRNVIVIPDNDKDGQAHALQVIDASLKHVASIRKVELPGNKTKGDITDWLEAGHRLEELEELIEAAKPISLEIIPIQNKSLVDFEATDDGNADAFLSVHGDDFLYCEAFGWLYWNGAFWEMENALFTLQLKITEIFKKRRRAAVEQGNESVIKCSKPDTARINACVERIRAKIATSDRTFDAADDYLNVKNGVINLRTGELLPHDRKHRIRYCLNLEYKKNASYKTWLSFLEQVLPDQTEEDKPVDRKEVREFLQRAVGYSLTGHTNEEILFYLYGPPRAGKGTFTETLLTLLGNPLTTEISFDTFVAKRDPDSNNFDLAPLKPARIIFASESNRYQSLNPAKLKQLTGGNMISCCFKGKTHFNYRPKFKIWLSSNWQVNGDVDDEALWGRLRVIRFPNSFLGHEDKSLKAKMKSRENLEGVLAWAVEGAVKWYAMGNAGLHTPKIINEETTSHRNESDFVQMWIDECCTRDEASWVSNADISASYSAWCKENNVAPKSQKSLSQSLQKKGLLTGVLHRNNQKIQKGVQGIFINS